MLDKTSQRGHIEGSKITGLELTSGNINATCDVSSANLSVSEDSSFNNINTAGVMETHIKI
jgi:hypothetical protein